VILEVVDALFGLRVKEQAEEEGLDISRRGELA
jgi:ammonia channel protein AmtB